MSRRDAVWSEQGTTPDAIETALRELLVEVHAEDDKFMPARVLNMIAFIDHERAEETAGRLGGVGRYHASRLLLLAYDPERERLDARVTIASDDAPAAGEVALLRETVVVELGERHLDDLVTIADPLVVTDLPTLLWSPHGHHDVIESLLSMSQAVLVDSVEEPAVQDALDRACRLSDAAYVVDLAWLRTTPWRERVAATFDPPAWRAQLDQIAAATVRHHPSSTAAALLLAGWLASRLGWEPGSLRAGDQGLAGSAHADGREIALTMRAAPELQVPGLESLTLHTTGGRCLTLQRGPGGLRATSEQDGTGTRRWTIPGASRGETGVLGEGIRQALLRDPTYLPALKAARALSS